MAHAASDHIYVPAAELRRLSDEVALLYARVSALADGAGVDIAPATALPANVFRLSDYRNTTRQAVSR